MAQEDSELIDKFKSGDKSAANQLIAKYYDRVVRAAQQRLKGVRVRATSEEDIAASVFESLWQRADENRFSDEDLGNTEELWKLLCTMVRFKARDHVRREKSLRRGGNLVRGESLFANQDGDGRGLQDFAIDDQSIGELAGFREQHEILMERLGDDDLREVATMRLEGFKVKEISERFSKSDRWVKRKLALIREIWSNEVGDEQSL